MFIIPISTPRQANSKKTVKLIESYAKCGSRSSEILLQMHFVANDRVLGKVFENFRIAKNHVYHKLKN